MIGLRGLALRAAVAAACVAFTPFPARSADDADAEAEPAPPERDFGVPDAPLMNMINAAALGRGPRSASHPQVNMAGFTRDYRPVAIEATATDAAIRAALDRPIEGAWEFHDASVRDVAERVREVLEVPVVLDERALADAGVDPDQGVVSARLADMSGRAALRIMLGQFDLTTVAANEVLQITTVDKAWERLVPVAYPLPRWSGTTGDTDPDEVVRLILETVAIETWNEVGGLGSINVVEASGEPLLVINQRGDVHEAVERLLRTLHGRSLAEFEAGRPVLKVHPVSDDRARADLERRLKDLCNATLGAEGDPDAEVTAVATTLAVRSTSPLFHALAGQVVAAVAGVEPRDEEAEAFGGGNGGQ